PGKMTCEPTATLMGKTGLPNFDHAWRYHGPAMARQTARTAVRASAARRRRAATDPDSRIIIAERYNKPITPHIRMPLGFAPATTANAAAWRMNWRRGVRSIQILIIAQITAIWPAKNWRSA